VKQDNRVGSVDWLNRRLCVDYEQDGAKCAWGSGVRCVEFGVITKLQVHRKGLVVTIGAKPSALSASLPSMMNSSCPTGWDGIVTGDID